MKNIFGARVLAAGVGLGLGVVSAVAQKPTLIVVNQVDKSVSFVDPVTGKQIEAVPQQETAVHAHEVDVTPDGKTAFLPVYGNVGVGKPGLSGQRIIVMDVPSRKITGYVDFGHPVRPHDPVYDPASGMLYVTTELENAVAIIDPKTLKIVGKIPTSQEQSHMLAISHDGKLGYTANVEPGTVSVLDMKARKTLTVIPLVAHPAEATHWAVQRIALSKDDKMVFTSDQTKPQLAVIDTATNKVKAWVELPGTGYGTAPTKDGKSLLVVIPDKNLLSVVDLATLKVVKNISVPATPQEVIVRPDGKVAYVSCSSSSKVAAIDVAEGKVQQLIEVGNFADGLAWAK